MYLTSGQRKRKRLLYVLSLPLHSSDILNQNNISCNILIVRIVKQEDIHLTSQWYIQHFIFDVHCVHNAYLFEIS